jgi:4-hydroxy-2-oxoheptanedioate aldolase
MRNPYKERLKAGKAALGLMLSLPSAPLAQVVARAGFDWMMIDREHGPIDIGTTQAMIAASQGTDCAPIVRIGAIDPELAKPVLDAGAFGVIFPMVKTAEEAKLAVASLRYPPAGVRGIGPIMASVRWGLSAAEYLGAANAQLSTVVLIEHIDAVRNLRKILAVEGIDVAQIAPFDLSASLGRPGELEHREVKKAIAAAEAAILKSGVALGGLGQTVENAKRMIARGYRSVLMTHDVGLIQTASAALLGPLRT